jgi:uncharacterized protein YdaU (DUF1376 family)
MSSLPQMPAYMEYPADILNNEIFMQLTMSQKGLLWLLRMYCWKNGDIPASYEQLSKLVRLSKKELSKLFDSKMSSFFEITWKEIDGEHICTERMINIDLEKYRRLKIAERTKRSEYGRKGAEKKWQDVSNGRAITSEMVPDMN